MAGSQKAETERLKLHIQARLHEDAPGGREHDALEFYFDALTKQTKWDHRRIITEALLALRMQWEKGYRPPDVQAAVLTDEMIAMAREARQSLELLRKHVDMLSTLDLSSLRAQPGWNEKVWEDTSTAVKGASAIMGRPKTYGDDDEDLEYYTDDDD